MKRYACLDIGGTAIKYGLIDETGYILEKYSTVTEAETILKTAYAAEQQIKFRENYKPQFKK